MKIINNNLVYSAMQVQKKLHLRSDILSNLLESIFNEELSGCNVKPRVYFVYWTYQGEMKNFIED